MPCSRCFSFYFFSLGISCLGGLCLVGLSLAYFGFRKRRNISLTSFWNMDGPIATIIDTITIIATVIGYDNARLWCLTNQWWYLLCLWYSNNSLVQVIIIIIMIIFFISPLSGLGKGVKIPSNTNFTLAIVLLAELIVLGPTVKIFDTMTDSIGLYFQNFFRMSFRRRLLMRPRASWLTNGPFLLGMVDFGHLLWASLLPVSQKVGLFSNFWQ